MLSDEERKAIDYLQLCYDLSTITNESLSKLGIVLNLIEKQSKEIEELKEKDDANLAYYDQIYQNGIYTGQKAVEDKIKAKIEEVEKWELYNMKIPKLSTLDERFGAKIGIKYVLQSLLEKE